MKMYLISDNIDTQIGMRLAGIDGVTVHETEEAQTRLDALMQDKNIGVILVTQTIYAQCEEHINFLKNKYKIPLITRIPDRHGMQDNEYLTRYVREAIGM